MKYKINLILPNTSYILQIYNYRKQHIKINEHELNGANGLSNTNSILKWIENVNNIDFDGKTKLKSITYMAIRESDNKLIGFCEIRYELNKYFEKYGGNIGYGVLVSERRKGYATEILRLSIVKAKELGFSKVLLVCDKNNIGSKKVIEKNNGIFEKEVYDPFDETKTLRYWIYL